MKILTVVGVRPQFMKAAMVDRYLHSLAHPELEEVLVHTGQHYDQIMSDVFFEQLQMKEPAYKLETGSGSVNQQIARILHKVEEVAAIEEPDGILVYGDTSTTLAAAIVGSFLYIPVLHVESGQRMYRRNSIPEEINRVLTDHAASLCMTCTPKASEYLIREGMSADRIRFVGDPMYDCFLWAKERLDKVAKVRPEDFGVTPGEYHLATIHRVQNTLESATTFNILEALDDANKPVLLPAHPRLQARLKEWNYKPKGMLKIIKPLSYFDFQAILLSADHVVTDSGGVNREAFFARKPCLVPMENAFWPEIVECGAAVEVGADKERIKHELIHMRFPTSFNETAFGDGNSARKIYEAIVEHLSNYKTDAAWHEHGTFTSLPVVATCRTTHANYREILDAAKSNKYLITSAQDNSCNFTIIHSLELGISGALELAQLEHEAGITSTFILPLGNSLINVFDSAVLLKLQRIAKLGHRFVCTAPTGWKIEAVKAVVEALKSLVNTDVRVGLQPLAESVINLTDKEGEWDHEYALKLISSISSGQLVLRIYPVWWEARAVTRYDRIQLEAQETRRSLDSVYGEALTFYPNGHN